MERNRDYMDELMEFVRETIYFAKDGDSDESVTGWRRIGSTLTVIQLILLFAGFSLPSIIVGLGAIFSWGSVFAHMRNANRG